MRLLDYIKISGSKKRVINLITFLKANSKLDICWFNRNHYTVKYDATSNSIITKY